MRVRKTKPTPHGSYNVPSRLQHRGVRSESPALVPHPVLRVPRELRLQRRLLVTCRVADGPQFTAAVK